MQLISFENRKHIKTPEANLFKIIAAGFDINFEVFQSNFDILF